MKDQIKMKLEKSKVRWFFLLLIFLLSGCGPSLEVTIDEEATRLIVDEERSLLTIYTRFENPTAIPSGPLSVQFHINDENLLDQLDQESPFAFMDRKGNLETFDIKPNGSYFISESFAYQVEEPIDELQGMIEVAVLDESETELARMTVNQVTTE
ncbi:hypothetical protein M3689_07480 [Alkalihalophilus marmarensis]|uniref:Lipoprotein n=1 Tax=Alkalihalophilus marmarensis DSM 21297 TaxID=1188261 RepID=U6SQH0_9BACI|nr:hypothetical protein [Alkalihalophilus marmarensis]ERN52881.1 hypothetical protein A33I_14455 [Alkalihalophilus marmarensis DSM 21297]MCM3489134.1 hypothetical protein [Alkalihalophilus marmarensis]